MERADGWVFLISNGFQASYEADFCNALNSNGVKIKLFSSDGTLYSSLQPGVSYENIRGSQLPGRSSFMKLTTMIKYFVLLFFSIIKERPRVVHLFGLFALRNPFLGFIELLGYRILVSSLYMTVHNVLPHNNHTKINRALYRLIYKLPKYFVVHTERVRLELVRDFGVSRDKVILMHHGVADAECGHSEHAVSDQENIKVLIFGYVSVYKGHDIALDALMEIEYPKFDLTIAGFCKDHEYESLIRLKISEIKNGHSVKWINKYVSEEEASEAFLSAEVVLLPYRHIDQSGVLFSAYRYGRPVVVTDVGSFSEYVPSSVGIVADGMDAVAIRSALLKYASVRSDFKRHEIIEFSQTYAWNKVVKDLVGYYRKSL